MQMNQEVTFMSMSQSINNWISNDYLNRKILRPNRHFPTSRDLTLDDRPRSRNSYPTLSTVMFDRNEVKSFDWRKFINGFFLCSYFFLSILLVVQKGKTKLTHVSFNPIHPIVIIGDDRFVKRILFIFYKRKI